MAGIRAPVDRRIEDLVHLIRGARVMLDADLALLYGSPTKRLNEAVRRNRRRFPDDFMFQLTSEEVADLRSQIVTSKSQGRGGRRYRAYAFTEQGVAMLSSVLNSERAIAVNILIMRTFVRLRAALGESAELRKQLVELERRLDEHGEVLGQVIAAIEAIEALSNPPSTHALGFRLSPPSRGDESTERHRRPTAR